LTHSKIRIIGGFLRGRQIPVVADTRGLGLRPTADRLRETVFNWLMHDIQGAVCLDLFSGSGALGLEAISRGAEWVIFLEQERSFLAAIEKLITEWNLKDKSECLCVDALGFISHEAHNNNGVKFDIVFCDPPFRKSLLRPALEKLKQGDRLNPNALIYVEYESIPEKKDADFFSNFESSVNTMGFAVLKLKKAGLVTYGLLRNN